MLGLSDISWTPQDALLDREIGRVERTASTILSALGGNASSSGAENGTGACGPVTVRTAADSDENRFSATVPATSVAIEHRGLDSSTTISREVFSTLAYTVSKSNGYRVRG